MSCWLPFTSSRKSVAWPFLPWSLERSPKVQAPLAAKLLPFHTASWPSRFYCGSRIASRIRSLHTRGSLRFLWQRYFGVPPHFFCTAPCFWVQQSEQQSAGKTMAAESGAARWHRPLRLKPFQGRMKACLGGEPAFSRHFKRCSVRFQLKKAWKKTWFGKRRRI